MPADLVMPVPETGTTRAVLKTLPGVPLLSVGTWAASTGVFHVGTEDLAAAIGAFSDPGYTRPGIKLGHVDARFDGQPGLGRIINPRLSDDGMTLVADLAGMPAWLADISASAFPRRSIEAEFGHQTQTGRKHSFALTAVALLGVEAPAVSTLADIAALYGLDPIAVAASAAHSMEESMPEPVRVAASVNLDTVRSEFYGDNGTKTFGPYAWIREVWSDFVIVDNDEGDLYQVPWSEDSANPGEILWGKPVSVRVQYVPDTSAEDAGDAAPLKAAAGNSLRAGALRARLATLNVAASGEPQTTPPADAPPTPQPEPATPVTPPATDVPAAEPEPTNTDEKGDSMSLSEFRSRLGLGDDADENAVLAALDARLQPPAPSTTEGGETQPEPTATAEVREPELVAASTKPVLPAGVVAVEASTLAELRAMAEAGQRAEQRQRAEDRDRFIAAAITDGKFSPARKTHWTKAYDADPEGVRETIDGLEKGLVVPVAAKGTAGGDDEIDPNALSTNETADWARQLGIPVEELTR